jgi:hypothetical protein
MASIPDRLLHYWYLFLHDVRWRVRRPPWERDARRIGLWPVFTDWVGRFALDAKGEPWFAERLDWEDRQPVSEPDLRHVVLALASRRYRRFRHLRPRRTTTAVTCTGCGGPGYLPLPPSQRFKIICQCGGVGWVEPEWLTEAYKATYPRKSPWE